MSRSSVIVQCDNYSKISLVFWHYYRIEQPVNNNVITQSESFKTKVRITRSTPASCNINDVGLAVPLNCLNIFWKTLEMRLKSWEINLILNWSAHYVTFPATEATKSCNNKCKLYIFFVTLSTRGNAKLL